MMHEQSSTPNGDAALEIIEKYRHVVGDLAVDPLEAEFPSFSRYLEQLGAGALYLARANDNAAGTFKVRGALNGAYHLQQQGASTIAVPSAGNHARGAIEAARSLGLSANIVVPTTAPAAKSQGLHELWPNDQLRVFQEGRNFNESLRWLLQRPELGSLLHPFDDPHVIAGQGTLVDDIFTRIDSVDHIVVPVGGGGLAAGIANRLGERGNRHTQLHLIQPHGSDSMEQSLASGYVTEATNPNMRYGGSAVQKVGNRTLQILRDFDRLHIHQTTEEEIDALISDYTFDRMILHREMTPNLEPTTLVAVAGMQRIVEEYPGESVLVVGTGQNAPLE